MKILILGGTGMLGHKLVSKLSKNHDVWTTVRCSKSVFPHFLKINLDKVIEYFDFSEFNDLLARGKFDVVINCIGIIKHAPESSDYMQSIKINSLLPHEAALICTQHKVRFIHFSTDCVFDGKKGNYSENDASNAQDLYGRTKLLGEVDYLDNTLTLRTSIIGREIKLRGSLIEWFLAQKGNDIKGYRKAIFSGLTTDEVSNIFEKYILPNNSLKGIYHLSAEPISKFDLLFRLNKILDLGVNISPYDDFQIDRSLNSDRFRKETGFIPRDWNDMISDLLINHDEYNMLRNESNEDF